jgi:hypothetical protein
MRSIDSSLSFRLLPAGLRVFSVIPMVFHLFIKAAGLAADQELNADG